MEETIRLIKRYQYELVKRNKISQMLKMRVAEIVRTKRRAAHKRAKLIQRQELLAQELAFMTGSTTPTPIDPKLKIEFEYIMRYLQCKDSIINDLFQSLNEKELKIIRQYLM